MCSDWTCEYNEDLYALMSVYIINNLYHTVYQTVNTYSVTCLNECVYSNTLLLVWLIHHRSELKKAFDILAFNMYWSEVTVRGKAEMLRFILQERLQDRGYRLQEVFYCTNDLENMQKYVSEFIIWLKKLKMPFTCQSFYNVTIMPK